MRPLFSNNTLRRIEQTHATAHPALMVRAGKGAAAWIAAHFAKQVVTVVAGPGHNGGDALYCAAELHGLGWPVIVHAIPPRHTKPALAAALKAWQRIGEVHTDCPHVTDGLVVDGLLGIGLDSAPDDTLVRWIDAINRHRGPIVALDVPTGLNADTGEIPGHAVRADHTLTFLADKPGLYTAYGRDHAGEVTCLDLGITVEADLAPAAFLVATQPLALPPRQHASHKGTYGTVAVVGGASGMTGAAMLAGRAALQCGAGKVIVGLQDHRIHFDPHQPELMIQTVDDALTAPLSALAVGPGLGTTTQSVDSLASTLSTAVPVIIDADGLNLLARHAHLQRSITQRGAPTILTPHPAEAARLLGTDTRAVQADRLYAAQELSSRYQCAILLKGSGSICTAPGHPPTINGSGNGALASAGQGDVLSGVILALVAQGLPPLDALRLAAYLHGLAGDQWRQDHPSGIGLTASDTIAGIRRLLNPLNQEADR
ncbi:NAD(P)H-hydrate dehydratase [Chitiniphilus purpureus]|uniref:Bifunctional NAD(P)H-hydrate repair enzyme n=1 Tax=Chitiniphilus purpureus TaxID=2981137 RepID=A0ABY6DP37_9NEIS|nr:NAD(P)H-hydrate dehydratase [Chitiniphilus sp. CD1]UXY16102.1 NAD(P)H-hydrate dehydratase [Chitiniphilus sp. CD1]